MRINWSNIHSIGPPGETKTSENSPESELLVYVPNKTYRAIKWGDLPILFYTDKGGTSPPLPWGLYNCKYYRESSGFILTITQD